MSQVRVAPAGDPRGQPSRPVGGAAALWQAWRAPCTCRVPPCSYLRYAQVGAGLLARSASSGYSRSGASSHVARGLATWAPCGSWPRHSAHVGRSWPSTAHTRAYLTQALPHRRGRRLAGQTRQAARGCTSSHGLSVRCQQTADSRSECAPSRELRRDRGARPPSRDGPSRSRHPRSSVRNGAYITSHIMDGGRLTFNGFGRVGIWGVWTSGGGSRPARTGPGPVQAGSGPARQGLAGSGPWLAGSGPCLAGSGPCRRVENRPLGVDFGPPEVQKWPFWRSGEGFWDPPPGKSRGGSKNPI
jgi:hypothetical protein